MAAAPQKRRLDPLVLVRGVPGRPLHPPLTDAVIGIFVLATGLAIIGKAGGIELAAAKGMWFALIGGLIAAVPTAITYRRAAGAADQPLEPAPTPTNSEIVNR